MKKQNNFSHVAILMEKIVMNECEYIFKPLHILEGKYLENENVFVDKYGNEFTPIQKAHIGLQENTEYFGFSSNIDELLKIYDTNNIEEAAGIYFDKICEFIYVGSVDSSNCEINFSYISYDSLQYSSNETAQVPNLNQETFSTTEEELIVLNEDVLEGILHMQNIDEIKSVLNEILIFFRDGEEEIELELEETEEYNISSINEKETNGLPFDINDMYKYVTSKVIDQDEAVKKIILSFAFHYLSVNSNVLGDIQPTRCLITGPTGVGKTLILETIIEYLDKKSNVKIPMVKVPTSQLTVAGYVGMNLEDILQELVSKTPNFSDYSQRIKYAEKNGLVFLDEIDKKGSSKNDDVSGRGVLNSLLQFLDGSNYEITVNRTKFYFNTKYLNIFASGAFTNITNKKSQILGFNPSQTSKESNKGLNVEDFIKEGQMPNEFMGRFHQIVELNPLDEQALQDILKRSLTSPLLIEAQKMKLLGINLEWNDQFIEEIAKEAHKLNLGARSLKTIIEKRLFDLKWKALTEPSTKTIKLGEGDDEKKYVK